MGKISRKAPEFQIRDLADEGFIKSLEDLTNTARNVDINNVAYKANTTIKLIEDKIQDASVTGKILLKMVMNKFASLKKPISGRYDRAYFCVQLRNGDEITSATMHHSFRPPLPDLPAIAHAITIVLRRGRSNKFDPNLCAYLGKLFHPRSLK